MEKNLEKGYTKYVLSCFSHVQLFAIPWAVARWAPLSMGFSRQKYWSGLPWPSSGDLPDLGIKPASLMSPALAGKFFTIRPHFPLKTCLFHRTHVAQKDETVFSNSMFFSSLLTCPVRLRPFDSTNSKSVPFSFPLTFFFPCFFFSPCCQSPRSFFSLFN